MALPVRRQLQYWGLAALAFLLALWALGDVMLPFVLGGAVAYVLDPVVSRLQRFGLGRAVATATVALVGLLAFALVLLLVVPILAAQLAGLVEAMPGLVTGFQSFVAKRFPVLLDEDSSVRTTLASLADAVRARGGELVRGVLAGALSFFGGLMVLVLVPVISFYLLLDWQRMIARIDELLPRDHAPVIRSIAYDIDRTLASFIRGQGLVCAILGTFYAVALMLAGLQFGAAVGVLAGVLTFIPYVGVLVGGALAIGLALFQFWGEWGWIIAVTVIFALGQFIEGNILTPRLVGGSVGLHPVWLIFALSAFGALFGFVGMLVAVPLAAALGVLVRFFLDRYRQGELYRGAGAAGPPP